MNVQTIAQVKNKMAVAALGLAAAVGFTSTVQAAPQVQSKLAAPFAKIDKKTMLVVAAIGLAAAVDATAGSDSTFTTIVTNLDDWMTGSLGKVFALGALGTGLAIGVVKQSVMSVVTGVAVALSASVGPGVLTNIFTATL